MTKKEMKMSLWTFYVLAVGMVVLIAGIVIGIIAIIGQNNQETRKNNNMAAEENQNETIDVEAQENLYKELMQRVELTELFKGVGLPTIYKDEYSDDESWYVNSEIMGSLCRVQNTDVSNIPNDLIVRMGFNLLFEEELSKEIFNYAYQGISQVPIGTYPSLDPETQDYNGPLITIEFSADKLKQYINKIFGNINYENEDYILFTTCKEFDGPWTDKYAKYNADRNTYTLYYAYEAFGEAWVSLNNIITDVKESNSEICINVKNVYCEYDTDESINYYANWKPTISKIQSILYPDETRKYKINEYSGEGIISNNVLAVRDNSYNDETYHNETAREQMTVQNYNGYSAIIDGVTNKYETREEAKKQLYREEILKQLPTYKYTFKKDKDTNKYYFYSFEKID